MAPNPIPVMRARLDQSHAAVKLCVVRSRATLQGGGRERGGLSLLNPAEPDASEWDDAILLAGPLVSVLATPAVSEGTLADRQRGRQLVLAFEPGRLLPKRSQEVGVTLKVGPC